MQFMVREAVGRLRHGRRIEAYIDRAVGRPNRSKMSRRSSDGRGPCAIASWRPQSRRPADAATESRPCLPRHPVEPRFSWAVAAFRAEMKISLDKRQSRRARPPPAVGPWTSYTITPLKIANLNPDYPTMALAAVDRS